MSFPLRLSAADVRGGGVGCEGGSGKKKGSAGGEEEKKKKGEEDEDLYELAAILIHKGTSAHHGHYVAHVALPARGKSGEKSWWRFDDEGVSALAGGPAGKAGAADHGVAAAPAAKKKKAPAAKQQQQQQPLTEGSGTGRERVRGRGRGRGGRGGKRARGGGEKDDEPIVVGESSADDNEHDAPTLLVSPPPPTPPTPSSPPCSSSPPPRITSTNAYMLLYRLIGSEGGESTTDDVPLPEDLRQWLREEESAARARAAAEAEAAAAARVLTGHRRAAVRRCLEAASVEDPIPEGARWVPARWFSEWCGASVPSEKKGSGQRKRGGDGGGDDGAAAAVAAVAAAVNENDENQDPDTLPSFPPCDVSAAEAVLCASHARVDPLRLGKLKLISAAAWEEVKSDVGGCVDSSNLSTVSSSPDSLPPLADALCRECTLRALELSSEAAARSGAAAMAVGAVEEAGGPDREPLRGDRWVSRLWYANWLRQRRRLSAFSTSSGAGAAAATAAKIRAPNAASAKADLLDAAGPTAAITCHHGRLLPGRRCVGPNRRSAVPEAVFELMLSDYDERWGPFRKGMKEEEAEKEKEKEEEERAAEGNGTEKEEEQERKEQKKQKKQRRRASVVDCGSDGVVEIVEDDDSAEVISSGDDDDDDGDDSEHPCRVAASATVSSFLFDGENGDGGEGNDGGCEECASLAAGGAAAAAELKSRAEREREAAPSLAAPPSGTSAATAPMPSSRLRFGGEGSGSDDTMALLPREWLRRWRAFVALATRRGGGSCSGGGGDACVAASSPASGPQPPPPLADAIKELCCSCHPCAPHGPRLGAPPPRLEQKRGKWGVASSAAAADASAVGGAAGAGGLASSPLLLPSLSGSSPWEVVPDEAAQALASLYGSPDLPTVRFRVISPAAARGFPAAAELVPSPPVCREAVAASAAAALDASLCYSEGTLQIEVCRPEDVRSPAGAGAGAAAAAPKLAAVGQRARRGRAAVEASAAETLWTVKLRALEHLGVHPRNADVYVLRRRTERTEGESASPERAEASSAEAAAGAKEDRRRPPTAADGKAENGDKDRDSLPPALVATAAFAAASNPAEFSWKLLEGDELTLRELRIPDGALLRLVDAGRVDGSDLSFVGDGAGVVSNGGGRKGRGGGAPERGFAGTALFGGGGGKAAAASPAGGEERKQKREGGAEEEGGRSGGNAKEEAEKMEVEVAV